MGYSSLSVLLPSRVRLGHLNWNNSGGSATLIHGLSIVVSLGIKKLMVYGDSLVVISQINKDWDCSTDSMGKYCAVVRKLEDKFE
jgi:ribonuclease HI